MVGVVFCKAQWQSLQGHLSWAFILCVGCVSCPVAIQLATVTMHWEELSPDLSAASSGCTAVELPFRIPHFPQQLNPVEKDSVQWDVGPSHVCPLSVLLMGQKLSIRYIGSAASQEVQGKPPHAAQDHPASATE